MYDGESEKYFFSYPITSRSIALIDRGIGSVGSVWAKIWRSRGYSMVFKNTFIPVMFIETSTDIHF